MPLLLQQRYLSRALVVQARRADEILAGPVRARNRLLIRRSPDGATERIEQDDDPFRPFGALAIMSVIPGAYAPG